MTLLAPIWFAAGIAAALGVLALHFLARRTPRAAFLPTARFLPERPLRATAPVRRPTHIALLAMRMLALIALGLAFARPIRVEGRREVARVVVIDASRSVMDLADARDSAAGMLAPGDALVVFDSAARVVRGAMLDSIDTLQPGGAVASLSAAMVASMRAAREAARGADSVEIVVMSPLTEEAFDAATSSVRAVWPGRIRLVRSGAVIEENGSGVLLRARADDPLWVTLALEGIRGADDAPVRLVRAAPTADDSSWVAAGDRVLVSWPRVGEVSGWSRRAPVDTIGAVAAGDAVVVAPMERSISPPPGRAIAWWVDGEPAATETPLGAGCMRSVAIPVTPLGDFALRESLRRLAAVLLEPCGGAGSRAPASDAMAASFAGAGSLADARTLVARSAGIPPFTRWLLLLAAVLLLAEMVARRPRASEAAP